MRLDAMNKFQTFSNLRLPVPLAQALQTMNFITPTPIQLAAIPHALEGKDILATAQTGTGKTAAFGIPLLTFLSEDRANRALILAPTRELAAQIYEVLRKMAHGLSCHGVLVVGGESFSRQVDDLSRGIQYVVATPGRLNDHLQEGTIGLQQVGLVVLDEVDRMLDMGFAPQIEQVMRHIPKQRQTLLFSATLPQEISRLANAYLNEHVRVAVTPVEVSAPDVKEETIETTQALKNSVLLKEIEFRKGRILIFTRTQSRADRVARLLSEKGQGVVSLHGGRSQGQRKQALQRFRAGNRRIMVATDLAGRGIDVPEIEHVINYDLPATREDYIHRIGRTGRNGKSGQALTLVVNTDLEAKEIITGVKRKPQVIYRSSRRFRR